MLNNDFVCFIKLQWFLQSNWGSFWHLYRHQVGLADHSLQKVPSLQFHEDKICLFNKKKKIQAVIQGMRFGSSIAHFIGSNLFSFKYCSPFFLRMVFTYFHSSIAHLERFVQDGEFSWTVSGQDSGGVEAKSLLGSANTVHCWYIEPRNREKSLN